ncbi:MAG TPA: permease [Cytophagales bacterium]|jgi:lipopolysaccharide export system permease protein|nr:permease [Cytophagales bacterium]
MLRILDRYIIKKLLTTYLFVVLVLLSIISVIDYTEKNEDFIKQNLPFQKIFTEYFLNFLPYMANMLSPLTIFIASVFVTARLASHTEIIAMLSGGISFRRLLWPYFLGSSVVAIFIFGMIGWVVPRANKVRVAFENQYIKEQFYFNKRHVHMKIAPELYMYMESYNNISRTGYQFTLEQVVDKELKKKIKTGRVSWNEQKQCWTLDSYTLREFRNGREYITYGQSMDTVLNITPKDFESNYLLYETFTLSELDEYIALLQLRGVENVEAYYVEKYERYAYPFAIIILTLMGAIVASRKTRGGAAYQIASGFVLAFIYILFVILSRTIAGSGGLSPMLAAWLPNMTFSVVALVLYWRVPK